MILSASTVPRSKLIPVSISYCNTWFLTRFYNLTLQQSTAISTAIYVAILHIFLLSFSGFQGFLHRLYLQIIYLLGWAANKLSLGRSSLNMRHIPRSALNMLRVPRSSLNMPPHPSLPTHSPFSLGFGLCKMWVSVGRYE